MVKISKKKKYDKYLQFSNNTIQPFTIKPVLGNETGKKFKQIQNT